MSMLRLWHSRIPKCVEKGKECECLVIHKTPSNFP
jgi:hypothetical protein